MTTDPSTPMGAYRKIDEARQRQAAQVIERAIDQMRTAAVVRRRWWRPGRDNEHSIALREVHEEVRLILDEFGIWHPAARGDSGASDLAPTAPPATERER